MSACYSPACFILPLHVQDNAGIGKRGRLKNRGPYVPLMYPENGVAIDGALIENKTRRPLCIDATPSRAPSF